MKRKSFSVATILIIGIFVSFTFGQNSDNKNGADNALRGTGRINPSTLALEIDIPLGSYPGRGVNMPISLSYSSKVWRMQFTANYPVPGGNYSSCYPNYNAFYSEESASGWTTSLAAPYIEYTGRDSLYNADGTSISFDDVDCPTSDPPSGSYPVHFIKRLVVHLPSGETHELRANDAITSFTIGTNGPNDPTVWNTTFYAVDGSNLKYVQDSTSNLYRLLMPDGSFYDLNYASGWANKAGKYTDRNGNYTTYNESTNTWTDTLGKSLAAPFGLSAPGSPTTQTYQLPGLNGTTGDRPTYKFYWKLLKGSSAAESGLTDYNLSLKPVGDVYICYNPYPTQCVRPNGNSLFYGDGSGAGRKVLDSSTHNPVVLTAIELPTGQQYKFTYDIYGKIEEITYPTGGKEVIDYSVVPTLSVLNYDDLTGTANFGVTDRRVYADAENEESYYHWTYEAGYSSNPQGYQVTTHNPDGTKVERVMHRGNDAGSSFGFGYDSVLAGMMFEERNYNSAQTPQLVSKKLTTWTKSNFTSSGGSVVANAQWHPRVTQDESQIFEGGSGISATTKYYYNGDLSYRETPLLRNKSEHYAFVAVGSSLPSNPDRTTETTFLISDSNYSSVASYYTNQNMIGLPTVSVVKNSAGTIISRSETAYDETGTYPILTYGSNPSNWQNPNTNYRGNPTTWKVWDSTKGASTSSSAYIATHAQFDSFGNQRKAWDAKGNYSQTEYASSYGYAFPTSSTSPVASDGTYGSNSAFVAYATFNPTTGLPVTTTDWNGLETRFEYDAANLRLLNTKTYYQSNPVGSASEIAYHDEANNYWMKNRAQIDSDKWAESIVYFDGLGRPYKTEKVDSSGNVYVMKEFDSKGRVSRVSNTYRLTGDACYQSNQIVCWTTNTYDEASRVKEVTMPGGAKIVTDYGVSTSGTIGVTKQITDQAGKKRKGISDAFGRMVRVIEDPTSQTPLLTDYVFDALDNLRKTTQDAQNRYFAYDSLGRLLYAKQPEQTTQSAFSYTDAVTGNTGWTTKYEYDDNGNATKTWDAKNDYVEGTYDNLNRIKARNYSLAAMSDVEFYYDGYGLGSIPAFSKGKTTKVTSSISETRYTSFDVLGHLLTSEQRTPFSDSETVSTATPRTFTYQYDAYGKFVSETYPSGRTVKVDYDRDGDLSRIWGTVGSNNRIYANGFLYNPAGSIERLRLGNGRWESYSYNNREQLTEIGLGNSATDKSLLKLEYGYGSATENNGNLRTQKISFTGLSNPFEQTYTYDPLNRLEVAEEKVNSSTTWKQTFTYDRYGNRRFDANNTTTLGSCSTAVCNPTINTSDNRFSSGQGYTYDATGNLTQDAEGKRFGYDAENHQKEFFAAGNGSSTPDAKYYYDGDGRRIKKTSGGDTVIFIYNAGGKLVAEYSTQLATTPQISYLTKDHLGSPRVITDQNGAVSTRKDYAAFGDETSSAQRTSGLKYDASETRKGYTGYEKDSESGLDFAQARYYSSGHGRFTSVDPLATSANIKNPQTFNRYSYVLNSPYKFTDPLGLVAEDTGSCGSRCPNSGAYVDGSAFRGVDSTLRNIFNNMVRNRNVERAIKMVEAGQVNYASGVSWEDQNKISAGFLDVLRNGNAEAKDIAAELVLGQITVTIAPTRFFHPSGQVYLTPGKQKALNEAINAPGSMTERDGLAYLTLSINSAELDYLPSLGANIVHEGNHATIIARVIYTLSTGNSKVYENETWQNGEQRVKEAAARYLKDRGGVYATYGNKIGLLDSTGKNVQVQPFQTENYDVHRFLTAGGIYWTGGGAATCCPRE